MVSAGRKITTIIGIQCGTGYRRSCPWKNTCYKWHTGEKVGDPIPSNLPADDKTKERKDDKGRREEKEETGVWQ